MIAKIRDHMATFASIVILDPGTSSGDEGAAPAATASTVGIGIGAKEGGTICRR
ncbi:hypothetical protein Pa4123_90800 [Phytohabitans aurantiacus]|uniref:Uncharacterized protein n=1 Tax=Phytohabitans aurantiacus TaxID=3016789 RepID=A0ABQ5RCV4_9ACTN|nr:hypothetical protein Pa4123_90800 [Phytohabitans aurantiacus]